MLGRKLPDKPATVPLVQDNGQGGTPITLRGNVEITATGRVSGSIHTDSLVISKGGFFNGNVTKIDEQPQADKGRRQVYPVDEKRLRLQK